MSDDTAGPIVVWENYGYEGWKPKSYPTIRDAILDQRMTSEFVITRPVDFQVVECTSITQTGQEKGIAPELQAEIETARAERAALVAKIWRDGLSHKDWLFDGMPVRGRVMIERFNNLDWDNAWVDLGPSIAGNPGPYWHVPLRETIIDGQVYDCGETVHRLYPKLLRSKWAMLVLHACYQSERRASQKGV